MKRIVRALTLALAIAAPAYLAGQHSVSPEYQKVMDGFTAAYNKGDTAGIAALYAQDALRVAPDGGVLSGRKAIQEHYGAGLAGPFKGATIKLTAGESRQLTPDILVVAGTWDITGSEAGPVSGHYLNTLVRKDGKWQIAGNMSMRPMQLAPPAR